MMAGSFNLNDYVQVNERIDKFYEKYPEGSIQTEIIHNQNGEIIFKAYAYRNAEDKHPTTGHAMEKEGSSFINQTSHIENCETSAVGRALAMMGFEIKKSVASREEVANARLNQTEDKAPDVISKPQANRIWGLSGANADICAKVLKKYGYIKSTDIKKKDYDAICKEVEAEHQKLQGDSDGLPWKE
jgi:hypothetical protein